MNRGFSLPRSVVAMALSLFAVGTLPAAVEQSAKAAAGTPAPTVLITGSSRGIGFELARQYAARGYRVIATARNPSGAANLVDLAAKSKNVTLEKLDVVDGASVAALAERLKGQPIDVLINNAGDTDEFKGQFFPKLAHDRFSYAMELNAHGPIRVAEALYNNVQASQQKKIVAISSLAGSFGANGGGMPGGYWYKSSKAALNMLMLTLANDSKAKGIVVASLSPGQVDTHGYAARGITMPGTVDVAVSVGGLIKVIDGLTMAQTGTFIRYSGEVQPW